MSLQKFNREAFNQKVFNFAFQYLNTQQGSELLKNFKYAFNLAAPWREKAYLLFAVGRSLKVEMKQLLPLAIASELVMAAALTVDDVFDNSTEREGKSSLYKRTGHSRAFLVAESMFALAIKSVVASFQTVNKNLKPEVKQRIIDSFVNSHLATQIVQYWKQSQNIYLLKTLTPTIVDAQYRIGVGWLFSATLAVPAYIAGKQELVPTLKTIGENVGMCLQHNNDIADFTWNKTNLGRIGLEDLYNGQPNIVLAYFLKSRAVSRSDKTFILKIWSKNFSKSQTAHDRKKVIRIIVQSGAIDAAKKHLSDLLARAKKHISRLPDTGLQSKIMEIVEIVGDV